MCSSGGSLGWKSKGDLDPKFEEIAFALESSSTSRPKFAEVKTGFGYHIVMVGSKSASLIAPVANQSTAGGRPQVDVIETTTHIILDQCIKLTNFFFLSLPAMWMDTVAVGS